MYRYRGYLGLKGLEHQQFNFSFLQPFQKINTQLMVNM